MAGSSDGAVQAERGPGAAPRVALLEDHLVMREGLAHILSSAGVTVTCSVGEPRQFLASVAATVPEVALIDLRYDPPGAPPDDGRWVLCLLRRRYPMVRTIVLSVSPASEQAEACARLGAWGYLSKLNAGPREVLEAVRAVAGGQPAFPGGAPPAWPAATLDPAGLTVRELEVLDLVAAGYDNLEIAGRLEVSENTVKTHLAALYRKLGVENRVQLALRSRAGHAGG